MTGRRPKEVEKFLGATKKPMSKAQAALFIRAVCAGGTLRLTYRHLKAIQALRDLGLVETKGEVRREGGRQWIDYIIAVKQ